MIVIFTKHDCAKCEWLKQRVKPSKDVLFYTIDDEEHSQDEVELASEALAYVMWHEKELLTPIAVVLPEGEVITSAIQIAKRVGRTRDG